MYLKLKLALNFQSPCLGLCSATYTSVPSWSDMLPMKCSLPSLFSLPCFGSITTLVYSCSFSCLHSAPSTLFSCPCCILNLLENECWAPHTAAMALSVLLTVLSPAPGLCQACLGMQGQGAFTPLSACSRSLVTHLCPPQIILASPTFDS